jgi:hypothetical protein
MEGEFLGTAPHWIIGITGAVGAIITGSFLYHKDKIDPETAGIIAAGGGMAFLIWPIILMALGIAALVGVPAAACWFAPKGVIRLQQYIQDKSLPKPEPTTYDPILQEAKQEVNRLLQDESQTTEHIWHEQ